MPQTCDNGKLLWVLIIGVVVVGIILLCMVIGGMNRYNIKYEFKVYESNQNLYEDFKNNALYRRTISLF